MDDYGIDQLIDFDGEILIVSEAGPYWVKFEVKKVERSDSRPHGLVYSVTLHGPDNSRLVGFDNAHPVPPNRRGEPQDHSHIGDRVKAYRYSNAGQLLEDFWNAVDSVLRKRGST